jgi:hypothetical protein
MMPIAGGARFRAALTVAGGTAGFVVPPEVLTDLGGGPPPRVVATVARHRFAAAIQSRLGRYWLAADPGLGIGQDFVVEVELAFTAGPAWRPFTAGRAWRPFIAGRAWRPFTASRAWRLGRPGRYAYRHRRRT